MRIESEGDMINRENYDSIISEFGIENLNDGLKEQHQNYLDIKEFYDDDAGIRESINLYFQKLQKFIDKNKGAKGAKGIKSERAIKTEVSPEIKRAKEDAKKYKNLPTEHLVMIYNLEQSYSVEDGEDEANRIRKAALFKELKKRNVSVSKDEFIPHKTAVDEAKKNRRNSSKLNIKELREKVKSKKVHHFTEDRKIFRRIISFHGKIKTQSAILNFIKSLQKAIVQKLITKKSPFAKEIRDLQHRIITYYNKMDNESMFIIPDKDLPRWVSIAGGEQVYKSIEIIKSFIGLQGKRVEADKLKNIIKRIERLISKGTIGKDDPYLTKVKSILKLLKSLKPSEDTFQISKTELNGLEGIVKSCGCSYLGKIYETRGKSLRRCKKKTYSDARKGACSHNKGLAGIGNVMTAEEIANMQFELLPFTGTWADLFGKPEKNFSLMIHGEPGAGKSTFLIKFTKYLSGLGNVLYVTSEEYGSVTLKDLITKYLTPFPGNVVFVPNLDSVNPGDYDFVIFDSITDAGLKLEDYKRLKAENPNTGFILVLQHTKNGQFKGGKEWEHEAQIVGKIENGTIEIYKNRYGVKNSWYFFDNLI